MTFSFRWTCALAFFLASPLKAQESAPPVEVFGESIDVRVVNVEAVVTDRRGERVRGLAASDFRLLVDGREVAIDYFAELADGAAVTASGSGAPVSQGERVERSYLVFVDDSIALKPQRDDLLKKLKLDLALLGPADRMAILAFDGLQIDVLAPWTGDAAALAAALDRARQRPVRGTMSKIHQKSPEAEVTLILESAAVLDDGDTSGPSLLKMELDILEARPSSPDSMTDIHKAADAAADALRAFEAPAGRKAMLLVSGAYALQDEPRLYGPLLSAANRLGYAVYPVDAAQSYTYALKSADNLARITGGAAVSPLDNHVLRDVARDTGTAYWLGFTPAWKADDRGHRFTVELRRPGLSVRSRRGFSDLSQRSRDALKAESVLRFGGERGDRRLLVKLGERRRQGREFEVPVALGVPVEALTLTQQAGGDYVAEIPMAFAALDEVGGRSETRARLRLIVPTLPKAGTYARFQTVIRLRDLKQRLVFTVPDAASGRTIFGEVSFERGGK
jgi:VWFA-related protein